MAHYRVGQGFDIHRLVEGRKFILGGIEIPYEKGFLAHSDGDVLAHAITDALLGAIGERDIGYHYPDTSQETINMNSMEILKNTLEKVFSRGFTIENIDSTIIANEPKLQPYIEKIKQNLSTTLNIDKDRIGVKAKTTEGFFYKDEAVMVFTTVLLKLIENT
ncbi:MAG: 2-C-methyl-D-erythritol 2,4-cyclodiphosphate synthase [Brevinematia bacterium]